MKEVFDKLKPREQVLEDIGPTPEVERAGVKYRAKVDKVQKTLRLQQVVSWLLDGNVYSRVQELCQEKWLISERQAARYIADARVQMESISAGEIQGAVTLALYRMTELYIKAVQAGDLKTALDVVKTSNRMLGLNAPDKIEAKTVANWDSMSVAQQLEAVGKILDRAQEAKREVN